MHRIVARINDASSATKTLLLLCAILCGIAAVLLGGKALTLAMMAMKAPPGVELDDVLSSDCASEGANWCCRFGSPCDDAAYSYCLGDDELSPVVGCCLAF